MEEIFKNICIQLTTSCPILCINLETMNYCNKADQNFIIVFLLCLVQGRPSRNKRSTKIPCIPKTILHVKLKTDSLKIVVVKLGNKEQLDSEQLGNSEPFSVTKLPVYFINSEQPSISEQFCDEQKVPYYQVRL